MAHLAAVRFFCRESFKCIESLYLFVLVLQLSFILFPSQVTTTLIYSESIYIPVSLA